MPAPKADPPNCDVDGCGARAATMTDGTEKDAQDRKAIPWLNVCEHHCGWPFSEDAKSFTTHKDTGPKYAARVAAAPKGK
jgi:hypothetical protein